MKLFLPTFFFSLCVRFFPPIPHLAKEPVIMLRSMLVMLACLVSLSTGFVAPTASLVARPALQESQVQRCVRSGLSHALLSRVRVACAHRSRWGAEISAPPRVSGRLTPTATAGRLTVTCGILRPRRQQRLLRRSDGTICSGVYGDAHHCTLIRPEHRRKPWSTHADSTYSPTRVLIPLSTLCCIY